LKGAIEVMILNRFGSMPVVDNYGKLLGMVSDLDLLKRLYSISEMPDDFYIMEKKTVQF